VSYASKQGYPTLAIDRLGNGLSDHPDPIVVVQMPAHAEVLAGVAQLARQGTSPLPRAFQKIIYVGHSFGSLIGNLVNTKYPDIVDATILTGWSNDFVVPGIPVALGLVTLPAQLVEPARFSNLPVGYLEVSSESGDIHAFFEQGKYDPRIQALDWARRGTLTLGEILTFPFAIASATGYNAPVFVVTAQQDTIFCNPTAGLLPPDCGTGPGNMLAQSADLYPAASVYEWYVVPNAGHCWQLHYTAQDGFNASHVWLEQQGF
jgi:pimeloyl-ACP methyl ester carboxylesterase